MTVASIRPKGIEPHVWRIAVVVILGAIMSVLDTTVVNVALDSLSHDLHAPIDSVQWVVTGYLLALAAVIPVTAWAGKRFGPRRLYISALILFTVSSALCGLAWSMGSLIGFRILQGAAGGMLMPIGQMVLVKAAGPANLPRVMSAIGVPIILAPVFGPTLGGLLLEHVGWQAIFLINVPIGALAVFAALRLFPADAHDEQAGRLDALGLVLAGAGTALLTYGLAQSGPAGTLAAPSVLVPFGVGVALLAAFVLRALRIDHPLLDIRLYRIRAFAAASLTTAALGAALFGAMILMPLYFQLVRGEDAVTTGLLLVPQGIGAALAMWASGRATLRWGGGATALLGGAIMIVATLPFVSIGAHTSYWLVDAAMLARGFGIGMSMMPAMTAAFTVLRADQVADASPQLIVLQRVGGSIGTAVFSVVLAQHLSGAHNAVAAAGAFDSTYWWVLGVTLVGLVPTVLLTMIERRERTAVVHKLPTGELALEAA